MLTSRRSLFCLFFSPFYFTYYRRHNEGLYDDYWDTEQFTRIDICELYTCHGQGYGTGPKQGTVSRYWQRQGKTMKRVAYW